MPLLWYGGKKMSIKRLRNKKEREAIRTINTSFLNKLSPDKIDQYIENKVTDLNSAKTVLKQFGKILLAIVKAQKLQ